MPEKKKGFDLAEKLKEVSSLNTGNQDRPQLEYIDIDLIDPDPRNRKIERIQEMAENIALIGLQQPLAIRPNPEAEGRYIVVSGHRRREGLKMLVDEGDEQYRMVPCLVGRPGESEAMILYRLLSGNAVNQPLTSDQLAKAAEDMQKCIYALKEEGYEFPGKVRDYVAKALQVSGPKLARLKVIREGLIPDYKTEWEKGKLGESVAYVVARFPADFQARLYKVLASLPGHAGNADKLEEVRKRFENGWDWNPCMTCPDGKECKRGDTFLRRDCGASAYDGLCGGKTCCLKCDKAKRDWSPCEQMCSKAKAARKEKKDAREAKAAQERDKQLKKDQKITQRNAQRLLVAIEAAGLRDEKTIPWSGSWRTYTVKVIREWAEGDFSEHGLGYGPELEPKRCDNPIEVAQLLGVSTDWLLGVTEEMAPPPGSVVPGPAAVPEPKPEAGEADSLTVGVDLATAPEEPQESPTGLPTDKEQAEKWVYLEWLPPTKKPEEGQLVALKFDLGGVGTRCQLGRWADGGWCFTGGTPMGAQPTGWFPLPDVEEVKDHD